MIKKDVWELISKERQELIVNLSLFRKEAKENQMPIGIIQCIITGGISNQIAINIMKFEDPKEM